MNPALMPVACELFAQWQRARGVRLDPAVRPFSRGWEELLEDARLVSALERNDAQRDAQALESCGWIEIKSVRYKSHLIDRVVIPLSAEMRWRESFGFVPPSDEEARRMQEFPWAAELAFVRSARLNLSFDELRRLNDFLTSRTAQRNVVPIKERSLQIFGDEKRLDLLYSSALFRTERLDLKQHLRCEVIGVPLAWKRGPAAAAMQPLMVIENAATWHSYCRWNEREKHFSGVVYGDGNRFADGTRYLPDIFAELGGPRRIFYFGDLDPQGLIIPQEASVRLQAAGWPPVDPHLWSYRELLRCGADGGQSWEGEPASTTLCDWLGECADQTRELFAAGKRLAQEHLGWEFLEKKIVIQP